MTNDDYRKWRILLAKRLIKRYHDCECRKRSKKWIYENFGVFLTGVNDETFFNYATRNPKVTGQLPLFAEAFVDLCEKFHTTAVELESGLKRPSEITDPECKPVVRAFLRRRDEERRRQQEADTETAEDEKPVA